MELIFKKIKIKNFKGITELELSFDDHKNIIEGENGIGKTTVLDAITWCLFGKNFADEKQFKIKPIIDGEEKKDLLTSVEIEINDKLVERIWDKDITTVKVDGVKFGSREFSDYLREKFLITDEEFKALSNIDYIPKLHWKDLRSLIMGLVGEIKNEDVYSTGDFNLIKEKIESVGIEKTADDIKSTKSDLNNDIKKLLGNIDQKTNDIKNLVIDEDEQKEYQARKDIIKKDIDNYNDLKQKQYKQNQDKQLLDSLKENVTRSYQQVSRLELEKAEYQKKYDESNIDVNIEKQNKIKELNNQIQDKENDIARFDLEKSTIIADRVELKKKYDEEINKEIKVENSTCSSCGQPLPENRIEEVLNNLKQESIALANGYAAQAKNKKARMDDIDTLISKYRSDIEELKKKITEVENESIDATQESSIQIMMKSNISRNNNQIENYKKEIKTLEEQIKIQEEVVSKHENIAVTDNISDLQNELEELTQKLAISDTVEIFKKQLKELEDKHISLLKEKELLNEKEQQLILFNNKRSEILKEKIQHNFKLVDFITQETTKDGNLIETFKIALDGVEYASINTGHKILIALDLIDNIQRLKNKRLPILIDGLGELTRLPELNTQIIGCRAKFQVNKKMELVKE